MAELPTGTVTFLFTDIEGSTRLLEELGERYRGVQDDHADIMRKAITGADGVEIRTEGDSFFAVFPGPVQALRAAVSAQQELHEHKWAHGKPLRVRMGMHTGQGELGGDDYLGIDVNRAARIAAAAHGGQILLSDATRLLVEHALPEGAALRDLGVHRLKDLARSERLHDVAVTGLPSDFPAPATLEVPSNLPIQLTSFVGRGRELEQIGGLIDHSRLLTLTGPGGTGKTRLAVQVAGSLFDRFRDGVFFVELAPITEPELVPRSIAAALGLRDEESAHSDSRSRPILDILIEHLRDRSILLVLDNFEQVLEAAPLVSRLLSVAPGLVVVATSRAPLRLQGEQEFPVPPLAVPGPEEVLDLDGAGPLEAVALFAQRAAASDPAFTLTEENAPVVAGICATLDGLPLAIELAASRIRLLHPAEMLERLSKRLPLLSGGPKDLPARQQTLRGAIGWSYDLLPEDVRTLFRRLSVFVGGWTIPAAEAVSHSDDAEMLTLEGLGALVDNSLIRQRDAAAAGVRFDMLQTIREYGLEVLDDGDEGAAVRARHADHFRTLVEEAEPELRGPRQDHWLGLLEEEHDNLRAALAWAIGADQGEVALRIVGALWRFWHLRGHLAEGRRWADEVLALPSAAGRTAARAKAVSAAGSLAYWQNEMAPVRRAYQEALAIYRELGDAPGIAEGTYNMSYVHALEGDPSTALSTLRESLELFRELGDRRGMADALWVLALVTRFEGDLPLARSRAEESLAIHRELGDRFGMTMALQVLGRVAFEEEDLGTARTTFLETMAMHEHMGNRTGITIALDNLAAQAGGRGEWTRAVRLAGASQAIKEYGGGQAPPALIDHPDPRALARGSLEEESIARAWEHGRNMTLDEVLAYARGDS